MDYVILFNQFQWGIVKSVVRDPRYILWNPLFWRRLLEADI